MKRRIRLYREGEPSVDGRVLVETTWAPEPLPLLLSAEQTGHEGAVIIGKVRYVRRGADGWVTGVIDTDEVVRGLAAEADFTGVETEPGEPGELLRVTRARLRAVTLGERPVWPEMVIE